MMTDSFQFDAAVLDEFSFLLGYGFSVAETNPTRVGYVSDRYTIYVYWGRHSEEIGLEFGPNVHTPFGFASLETLVATFDEEAANRFSPSTIIRSPEAALERIKSLGRDFRRFITPARLNSADLWDTVVAKSHERFQRANPTNELRMQARFQDMWNRKDYEGLIRIFEPLASHLSEDEQSKLAFAKTMLSAGS